MTTYGPNFVGPVPPAPIVKTPFGGIRTGLGFTPTPTPKPFGDMTPSVAGLQIVPPTPPPVRTPLVTTPSLQAPGGYGQSTNPVFGTDTTGMIQSSDNNSLIAPTPPPFIGPPSPTITQTPVPTMPNLNLLNGLKPLRPAKPFYPNAKTI